MAGITSSIISAFLQHQFAKERQEQENQQREKEARQQQQARLQQALMMREIIGDQAASRQKLQIEGAKLRQKEALDLRKQMSTEALKFREQSFKEKLADVQATREERSEERTLAREEAETRFQRQRQVLTEERKATEERAAAEFDRRQVELQAGREELKRKGIEIQKQAPVKAPGRYLNLQTGARGKPGFTMATAEAGGWMEMDTEQEKAWIALNNIRAHIEITRQQLGVLAKRGMRPTVAIGALLGILKNDPRYVTLFHQLEALTPLAIGRSMIGATGRAGPQLAQQMIPSGIEKGDNLQIAIKKLGDLDSFVARGARANDLPLEPLFRKPAPSRSDLGAAQSVARDPVKAKQLLQQWGFDISQDVRDE